MEDNDQQDELEKMVLISANPELASSKESVFDPENELAIESNEMNVGDISFRPCCWWIYIVDARRLKLDEYVGIARLTAFLQDKGTPKE